MISDEHDEGHEGYQRLREIASRLKAGEKVAPVMVRDLVRWFGAEYRGSHVNDLIRDSLFQNNLRVEPDLNMHRIDGSIEFREGVLIDEIDQEFFANYRKPHKGQIINDIEAKFLQKLWIERVRDVVRGWIDRNPDATEAEIRAKTLAMNELDFESITREEEASYIIPFPSPTIRGEPQFTRLNAIGEERSEGLKRLYTVLGRFIFEFSQLDRMLRRAVGEALKLSNDRFHVITSSYDFAKLCQVVPNLYRTVSGCTEKTRGELEGLCKGCLQINDKRVQIVHSAWFASEEGSGAEYVSRTSLKPAICFPRSHLQNLTDDVIFLANS